MILNFRKYAQTGEAYVNKLAKLLRPPLDRDRAARILKAVLHSFRDQVSPVESMQLVAQLPMFLKAVYIDGWKIDGKYKKIRKYDDFIDEVMSAERGTIKGDFYTKEDAEGSIYIVFGMIKEKVSLGEIDDLLSTMPQELRPFLARVPL